MYKKLVIELTNYCNAACPQCAREDLKKDQIIHMQDDVWDAIVENLDEINSIMFNGNFGDFSMHPKALNFLDKLADKKSNIRVSIHTNGGARNELFWSKLADICNKFAAHTVHFAFDGLEDTNHIHRRNVVWERLVRNAKAFNDAGGRGVMRTIVFDHNYHQIDDNAKLAKELNFSEFEINRALEAKIQQPDGTVIVLKSSKTSQEIRELAKIKNKKFKNYTNVSSNSFRTELNKESLCPWKQAREAQISAEGIVWPCCHWHAQIYKSMTNTYTNVPRIIEPYLPSLNIIDNKLQDIYYNQFNTDLENIIKNRQEKKCNNCEALDYTNSILG